MGAVIDRGIGAGTPTYCGTVQGISRVIGDGVRLFQEKVDVVVEG